MQKLTIERTNGNIPGSLPGEDHISGLVFYSELTDANLPEGFTTSERIKAISDIESAHKLGITADSAQWDIRVLHYVLEQTFAMNPGISLYVGIFKVSGIKTFAEIKKLQNFAGGRLRQIGVWDGHADITGGKTGDEAKAAADTVINALKGTALTLQQQDKPLCVLYAPKVSDITKLPTEIAGPGRERISVIIAQDGAGTAAELYDSEDNTGKASVTALGDALGALSAAKVHQSIAWVEQFPTNIAEPAFSDGTKLRDLDAAVVEELDAARYIFAVTYDGLAGSYFNDNHTLDVLTSDYAHIDRVRTMDKAVRGVRTYLIPKLGRPLLVDASTGKLDRTAKEYLETQANIPLEEMAKAGELSGYKAEIDPNQNVLQTSTVEIVIKNVPVGVNRNMRVKVGFTTKV